MIAVSFALPQESSAFVRRLSRARLKSSGATERLTVADASRFHPDEEVPAGSIASQTEPIKVLHTGVGAKVCAARLRPFLETEKPRVLISSGFCGGTRDHLQPGDAVIALNRSARELAERARRTLPQARFGMMYSAERVIDLATDRYRIGREHDAIAIDMETKTIAQLAAETGVPMLSLRVVSDSPSAPFPAPPEVLFDVAQQRTRAAVLLPHLARNPRVITGLARFSRQVAHARAELARLLCAVLEVV